MSNIKSFDEMNDEEREDWSKMMAELMSLTMLRPLYSGEQLAEEKAKFDAKWAKYGPFGE